MKAEEVLQDVYALMAEQQRRIEEEKLQETDITIRRIMDRFGVTDDRARRLAALVLDPLVEQGTYKRLECQNPRGGGKVVAYRLVEKKERKI